MTTRAPAVLTNIRYGPDFSRKTVQRVEDLLSSTTDKGTLDPGIEWLAQSAENASASN